VSEIEFEKLLLFLLDVVAYIADESEYLGDDGVHFYFNVTVTEYLMAGLERSLVGRYQYDIDLLIFKQLLCLFALLDALRRQRRIDILLGIAYSLPKAG
jgi:hypothetical protein